MDSPLPPINHKEDIELYQAYSESKPVEFPDCKHTNIKFCEKPHELRCDCGVAFSGERLGELYQLLTKAK